MNTLAVCFVCLGNICRSPTAEAVFRRLVDEHGLSAQIRVDSAGTGDWHVGEAPDDRAQEAAALRGYDLSGLRGRQIANADFDRFDLLIAMDDKNVAALTGHCPPAARHKLHRLMEFLPADERRWPGERQVADPYFGGASGFETVLDQCEAACRGLLDTLRDRLENAAKTAQTPTGRALRS